MTRKPQIPDHKIHDLADRSVWVLDVDDCLYSMDCGLHHFIKGNIVRVFNAVAKHDPQKAMIIQKLEATLEAQNITLPDPTCIRPEDLGSAFTPIVKTLGEVYPDKVMDYLNHFYGNAYDLITPDRDMVEAFRIAHNKSINIHIYTNGPSSPEPGADAHFQKVLYRHGFDKAMIERLRTRTYDLMMSVKAGRGKPELLAMQDFISFAGIDPSNALMADDSVKNLKPAAQFGMATLWTWTSAKAADPKAIEMAKQIQAVRVRDTGAALLQIAKAYNA